MLRLLASPLPPPSPVSPHGVMWILSTHARSEGQTSGGGGLPWPSSSWLCAFNAGWWGFSPWLGNKNPTCHAAWPKKKKNLKCKSVSTALERVSTAGSSVLTFLTVAVVATMNFSFVEPLGDALCLPRRGPRCSIRNPAPSLGRQLLLDCISSVDSFPWCKASVFVGSAIWVMSLTCLFWITLQAGM